MWGWYGGWWVNKDLSEYWEVKPWFRCPSQGRGARGWCTLQPYWTKGSSSLLAPPSTSSPMLSCSSPSSFHTCLPHWDASTVSSQECPLLPPSSCPTRSSLDSISSLVPALPPKPLSCISWVPSHWYSPPWDAPASPHKTTAHPYRVATASNTHINDYL